MDKKNYPEALRRTDAPFAIDGARISRSTRQCPTHITRLYGAGSIEYVLAGKGVVTENDVTFSVKEGDVFILHAGNYHDYHSDPDDPWTRIWLRVSGPAAAEILRAYGLQEVHHIPDIDLKETFFRIHYRVKKMTDRETVDREGPSLLLELVQKIHDELREREQQGREPLPAEAIRRRIDSSPDGAVTLDQLANEFHFTKQYLIRIFKARYGIPPNEYILNRRVGIAQSLLKKTNLPISEIARQLHFCDVAYFTDFFRRRTGTTPSDFRKKYR